MSTATATKGTPYPAITRRALQEPTISTGKIDALIHLANGVLPDLTPQSLRDTAARFLSQQPTELDFLLFSVMMRKFYPEMAIRELQIAIMEVASGVATMYDPTSTVVMGTNLIQEGLEKSIHIQDVIRLQGKTEHGIATIGRYGPWWKVIAGRESVAFGVRWFLMSLPAKDQGKFRGTQKINDSREILKSSDPDFKIVDVCAYPGPFDPKNYKE